MPRVLVGGGLGSVARYLMSVVLVERLETGFPWGIVAVNLIGSFLSGLIATLADERGHWEVNHGRALLNVLSSIALALAAVWLGALARRGRPRWTGPERHDSIKLPRPAAAIPSLQIDGSSDAG